MPNVTSSVGLMPSRQERRKAEREAAKSAPGQAGAGGAGGAAAGRANVHVNPVGDWTTQTEDYNVLFRALGFESVKRKVAEGDKEAQFSLGEAVQVDPVKPTLKASGTKRLTLKPDEPL